MYSRTILIHNAELTVSFEQLEYTVHESDGMVSLNVSITSAGGWAVPLQFSVMAQDYTALSGQNLTYQNIYLDELPQLAT